MQWCIFLSPGFLRRTLFHCFIIEGIGQDVEHKESMAKKEKKEEQFCTVDSAFFSLYNSKPIETERTWKKKNENTARLKSGMVLADSL